MNKMTGLILIGIGFVVMLLGMVVYTKSNAKDKHWRASKATQNKVAKSNNSPQVDNNLIEKTVPEKTVDAELKYNKTEPANPNNSNDLKHLINAVIADGVFTKNERDSVKIYATEKSLDSDVIVARIEKELKQQNTKPETAIIDYNAQKGLDFEKYVVEKFSKKYFKIKEWAGDKYVNGTYAENTLHPDIVLEFKMEEERKEFAVECKWRNSEYKNAIEFSKSDQLARYKKFQKTRSIPVFIAIGLGGTASDPARLFNFPLKEIESPIMQMSELEKYEKQNLDKNFFFNAKTEELH
jgi:hypothetical protein